MLFTFVLSCEQQRGTAVRSEGWPGRLRTAFQAVQCPDPQVLGLVSLYSTYFLSLLHPISLSGSPPPFLDVS